MRDPLGIGDRTPQGFGKSSRSARGGAMLPGLRDSGARASLERQWLGEQSRPVVALLLNTEAVPVRRRRR